MRTGYFNEEKCCFCQECIGQRVGYKNVDGIQWIYMMPGEISHAECYTEKCCEQSLLKKSIDLVKGE